MISLMGKLCEPWDEDPYVARIEGVKQVVLDDGDPVAASEPRGVSVVTVTDDNSRSRLTFAVESELSYLESGDVIRVNPRKGQVWVIYRRRSRSNSLLLTERCNSYCVMCSQPPKLGPDGFLVDIALDAIPLMAPDTLEIGLTGGEPTLLGNRLFDVLNSLDIHLPDTGVHLLSNGRKFANLRFCRDLVSHQPHDFMVGIPIYSDLAYQHDYVVQSQGAYDETIRGILNLGWFQVPVELRVVVQQANVNRLVALAEFICRNLPFVSHVAFMGLEMMGFARPNLEAIWVDPADYQSEMMRAVTALSDAGIAVSIYNHQLCTLDPQIWAYARKSISDWKNEYLAVCAACAVREQCGGFFTSSTERRSRMIRAIAEEELSQLESMPTEGTGHA